MKYKTLYNRYGEYDPGREDDPTKWVGKCDKCGKWIAKDEPCKGISVHKIVHRYCPDTADQFQESDPEFKRELFIKQCGVTE